MNSTTGAESTTMIPCDNCERNKAVTYNNGDRVCGDCDTIIKELRVTNPELYEKGDCILCGAENCEDALCREEREAMREAQENGEIEPLHPDYEDDRTTFDMSDDADALASAGWGTDEDYGCYGED